MNHLASPRRSVWSGLLPLLLPLALVACGKGPQGPGGGMFGGGPVPVAVQTVQPESLPLTLEYTGQTQGSREVEVRARVTGILGKRNYQEGRAVKAGQSLFTIDPAPFAAALARAEAELAAAEARSTQAAREATRLAPLAGAGAISQKELDDSQSTRAVAAADVLAARARVDEARLNLGYTRVEAPIGGIASRAQKSEGALVSGPDVLLTTISQVDPMHVIFGVSDTDMIRLRQEVAAGRVVWPNEGRFKVSVKLADGGTYARSGTLDFADVRVSRDTGTSEARAEIANPDGVLRPGQFVRVSLSGASRPGAFKVVQRAVLEGPQGKFVFVVGKDGKAEIRPVEVGDWIGDAWVVTKGLTAGDQVIVDGLIKLGPGVPVQIGAPAAAPGGAAAAAKPAGK